MPQMLFQICTQGGGGSGRDFFHKLSRSGVCGDDSKRVIHYRVTRELSVVNEDKNGVMLRCNTEVIAFEVQGETPD
jgi:hypothetical protein